VPRTPSWWPKPGKNPRLGAGVLATLGIHGDITNNYGDLINNYGKYKLNQNEGFNQQLWGYSRVDSGI